MRIEYKRSSPHNGRDFLIRKVSEISTHFIVFQRDGNDYWKGVVGCVGVTAAEAITKLKKHPTWNDAA